MSKPGVAALVLLTGLAHGQQKGAKQPPPKVDQSLVPGFVKVVEKSGPIFTAKVLRRSVRHNRFFSHSRRHKYVESVRLQVMILQPLQEDPSVEQLKKETPRPWLIIPNGNPPRARFSPDPRLAWQFALSRKLKPGDHVVVYLRPGQSATIEKRVVYYQLQHLNRISMLPTLHKALAVVSQSKLAKLRRKASCKTLHTWRLKGGCHETAKLAQLIPCPDGTKAKSNVDKGLLSFWCVTAKGEASGPYLKWLPNGDLGWRGSKVGGKLHGEMVHYLKSGKPGKRIEYRNGKMHGGWIAYHPNGQIRSQRQMVNGVPDGECKQYDKAGKLLGSYTLKRGNGVVTEWYDSGQKQREMHHRRGKMHGPYKVWYENGKLSLVGQNRNGHSHGKWYNYNSEGELEMVTCYRRDREIWDTTDVKRGRRRRCR